MRVTNGITKIKTASINNKFFNWIGTILLLVGFITIFTNCAVYFRSNRITDSCTEYAE